MGVIAGLDPGNEGALAFLDPERALMRIVDIETFEFRTTKNNKKIDPFHIARELSAQEVAHAYIEDVTSSPQMGVVGAFSFGEGKGILIGSTAALGIPTTMVRPQQWKSAMRVAADKRMATARASQLLPALAPLFKGPRGGTLDGRAEAALIALYGAMELGRTPTRPVNLWESDGGRGVGG